MRKKIKVSYNEKYYIAKKLSGIRCFERYLKQTIKNWENFIQIFLILQRTLKSKKDKKILEKLIDELEKNKGIKKCS